MRKHLSGVAFWFLVITGANAFAATESPDVEVETQPEAELAACNTLDVEDFLEERQLVALEIETKKSRKWAMNYFKILLDPARNIHPDRKKKFTANITARFSNGIVCNLKAKIRIHGDWKDHVRDAPALVSSLDVKLNNGNIDSVVGFKLLLPHTRNGDNEVFVVSLLEALGFITPKTYYVPTTFNGVEYRYLFQEKARKELLEAHNLREGPILEGDERFAWLDTDRYGVDDRFGLARIGNENWTRKGATSLQISQQALNVVNDAYLEYVTAKHIPESFSGDAGGYGIYLSNRILGNSGGLAERKNSEYVSLMIALHATHALAPHNRKFYYDPTYMQLLPIYYDGDAKILNLPSTPLSREYFPSDTSGARSAISRLDALDKNKLLNLINERGVSMRAARMSEILAVVRNNLETIQNSEGILRKVEPKPYFSIYNDTDKSLVFSGKRPLEIIVCNLSATDCETEELNIADYASVLGGRYVDHQGRHYIYVGSSKAAYVNGPDPATIMSTRTLQLTSGVKVTLYGSLKAVVDRTRKVLSLTQQEPSDRALVTGEVLEDWRIEFAGMTDVGDLGTQRFDEHLLTGCLTLLDLELKNVSITANEAQCEDAINLVRTTGDIEYIGIDTAEADALDIDFSDLTLRTIEISNAGNDCFDVSSGTYKVERSRLTNCADKAISVGEGSTTQFTEINITGANIGIAVKDSSVARIDVANIADVTTCLSATRKKQEYWGSKIEVHRHTCADGIMVEEPGSAIEILE